MAEHASRTLESEWERLTRRVRDCKAMDAMLAQKAGGMAIPQFTSHARDAVREMGEAYVAFLATQPIEDLSDETLLAFERYTDGLPLKDFENALELVPSLVNLVSLADALPLDGSSLPFDLRHIAVRCKNAVYFAPRRFTAVQLAFDEPRSRVLLFHTGRMVGTGARRRSLVSAPFSPAFLLPVPFPFPSAGCNGPTAAKLAVVRALKSISEDAGVKIGIRRFSVINQVRHHQFEHVCGFLSSLPSSPPHPNRRSAPWP